MKLTWFGHSAFRVEFGECARPDRPVPDRQSVLQGRSEGGGGGRDACARHARPQRPLRRRGRRSARRTARCSSARPRSCDCGWRARGWRRSIRAITAARSIAAASPSRSSTRCIPPSWTSRTARSIYLGNPLGLVVKAPGEPTLYHMGDTGIFGDMALIHADPSAGDRHRADRRPLHDGRRHGGDGLPALLQVPPHHPVPLRRPSRSSTRPPDKFIREMGTDGQQGDWCRRSGRPFEV